MVIYVLDASALLRFLLKQAGARHVLTILELGFAGQAAIRISAIRISAIRISAIRISAINWGEVVGRVDGEHGRYMAEALAGTLKHYGLEIIPIQQQAAQRAALIKRDWDLGYADAFCVELALRDSQAILVTADFDFKKTEHLVNTDFLHPNPSPGTIGPVQ